MYNGCPRRTTTGVVSSVFCMILILSVIGITDGSEDINMPTQTEASVGKLRYPFFNFGLSQILFCFDICISNITLIMYIDFTNGYHKNYIVGLQGI